MNNTYFFESRARRLLLSLAVLSTLVLPLGLAHGEDIVVTKDQASAIVKEASEAVAAAGGQVSVTKDGAKQIVTVPVKAGDSTCICVDDKGRVTVTDKDSSGAAVAKAVIGDKTIAVTKDGADSAKAAADTAKAAAAKAFSGITAASATAATKASSGVTAASATAATRAVSGATATNGAAAAKTASTFTKRDSAPVDSHMPIGDLRTKSQLSQQDLYKAYMAYKDSSPTVRVRLATRSSAVHLESAYPLLVKSDGKVWGLVEASTPIAVSHSGSRVVVNDYTLGSQVDIAPLEKEHKGTISIFGKTYRGAMRFLTNRSDSALLVLNVVPMEEYLYGVVPMEAVPSWPIEALKAQAVAARTYALYTKNMNRSRPYDLEVTTWSQVYGGKSGEYPKTTQAVDDTAGEILTYNGLPIDALFSADAGGFTENSENVWGNYLPYLRAVKDYAHNPGTSSWTITTSRRAMSNVLKAAGKDVGLLQEIRVSPLGQRPMKVPDRGASGRILRITFVGDKGRVTLRGSTVENLWNLQSSLVDFYVKEQPKRRFDVTAFKNKMHQFSKDGSDDLVYIVGFGWGHGLGLSQWGAAAMAESGPKDDPKYYRTILNHYYTNVKLEKAYDVKQS